MAQMIAIPRDYSHGTYTRFDETFPVELEGKVTQEEFRRTISSINVIFAQAEALDFTSFIEGCLGCLTFYTFLLCYEDRYKKKVKELNQLIFNENERVYRNKGLEIINPIENGLLKIDIISHQLSI